MILFDGCNEGLPINERALVLGSRNLNPSAYHRSTFICLCNVTRHACHMELTRNISPFSRILVGTGQRVVRVLPQFSQIRQGHVNELRQYNCLAYDRILHGLHGPLTWP